MSGLSSPIIVASRRLFSTVSSYLSHCFWSRRSEIIHQAPGITNTKPKSSMNSVSGITKPTMAKNIPNTKDGHARKRPHLRGRELTFATASTPYRLEAPHHPNAKMQPLVLQTISLLCHTRTLRHRPLPGFKTKFSSSFAQSSQ